MTARRIKTTQVTGVRAMHAEQQGGRCGICMQPTAAASQVLDHDHKTGVIRGMLCRNCNGIEGKILSLARRGQRQYDPPWFLKRVTAYWEKHDRPMQPDDLLHPTHKTADEKRERVNKMATALLAGCSNGAELRSGDYMDALTTAALPIGGLLEANPLISSASPGIWTGVAALGLKYAVKSGNIELGLNPEEVNARGSSIGWIGACWNTFLIAGAAPPIALIGATLCYTGSENQ